MKGFLGAFLVFSLWAVGSIYYLHLKDDTPKNEITESIEKGNISQISNSIVDGATSQKKTKDVGSVDVSNADLGIIDTLKELENTSLPFKDASESTFSAVPDNAFANAQLLADEIKKTIAISDTIDIDKNEPEQSLENKIIVADGPSVSTRIFYPQYNNTDLVLDKEIVAYASELKQLLIDHPEKKVTIIGYTDNIGNGQDNFKIALRKSRQVKWYLTARRGIPRSKVTATSRGEEEPIESNTSTWGRAKNNRIEIIID
jgi:outer membrane protein OmpA-like peptidoglycan-associated protein